MAFDYKSLLTILKGWARRYKIKVVMQNQHNQKGFIPLMVLLLLVVGLIVWFVYKRVANAGG